MADTLRMRSDLWPHITFGMVFTLPLTVLTIGLVRTGPPRLWPPALLVLALSGLWHLYYRKLLLTVSEGMLTYHTIFETRSVPLAAILSSRITTGSPRMGGVWQYRPWLWIHYSPDEELAFSLKPFRLAEVHRLLAMPELKLDSFSPRKIPGWRERSTG